jgi:hypothetical protein
VKWGFSLWAEEVFLNNNNRHRLHEDDVDDDDYEGLRGRRA